MSGNILVATLASGDDIGISWVEIRNASEYPIMYGKAPWQRIVWLQMPIVLRLKKNPVGTFYQQIRKSGGNRELHMGAYEWCTTVLPTVHRLELGHMAMPNREQD